NLWLSLKLSGHHRSTENSSNGRFRQAGVASSACHSEQSTLLMAALLPLPSRSLADHFRVPSTVTLE
ncbi:MAG: hypothetical protein LHW48_04540, partial [Candidatus Cloacimonetes bacterium]|nr:hypothetical protein [Candidatus Cloacimonadota bacterium]